MKAKLFVTAMAVTFSLAVVSCKGNKAANTAEESDSTRVETVEAAVSCNATDTCCQGDSVCAETCNKEVCKEACDKATCRENCEKDAKCESKKECCKEKAACDKK